MRLSKKPPVPIHKQEEKICMLDNEPESRCGECEQPASDDFYHHCFGEALQSIMNTEQTMEELDTSLESLRDALDEQIANYRIKIKYLRNL